MNIITYKYSKALWLLGIVIPAVFVFICMARINEYNWEGVLPAIAVLSAVAVYYCRQCFTYDFQDKPVLELDHEKLIYHIERKVIYWRDITDISYGRSNGQGMSIFITVRNGNIRDTCICITTDMIAGKDKDIYEDIIGRFCHAKGGQLLTWE